MIKKIIAVNDISGLGRCSLTAAIPVISSLGVQTCPLPTAVLSNQTCFESFCMKSLTENMADTVKIWHDLGFSFDGIYSGFLAEERQADILLELAESYKQAVFVLDPVMGDKGEVYSNFSDGLLKKMQMLAEKADIITPNVTELCLLCENSYKTDVKAITDMAKTLLKGKLKSIVVTGITSGNMIQNIVLQQDMSKTFETVKTGGGFSGTGDIMSSIIAAYAVKGRGVCEAVEKAADFISGCIEKTVGQGFDPQNGVDFELMLDELVKEK